MRSDAKQSGVIVAKRANVVRSTSERAERNKESEHSERAHSERSERANMNGVNMRSDIVSVANIERRVANALLSYAQSLIMRYAYYSLLSLSAQHDVQSEALAQRYSERSERASVSAQYERSEYGVIGTMSAANSDEQI
jgi:hypothetical protein